MEKQETIANIIADMRKRFFPYAKSDASDARYVAYLGYQEFPDRIEAAWKRERVEVRETASTTILKERVPVAVGNAAAICEALVNISRYADCATMRPNDAQTQEYIEQIRKWANAALKEPARNCDLYPEYGKALSVWTSTNIQVHPGRVGIGFPTAKLVFSAWLLAKATTKKGETDGSK